MEDHEAFEYASLNNDWVDMKDKLKRIEEVCRHPDIDDFQWLRDKVLSIIKE